MAPIRVVVEDAPLDEREVGDPVQAVEHVANGQPVQWLCNGLSSAFRAKHESDGLPFCRVDPNRFHQNRTASWATSIPRSCSRFSMVRNQSG